jgi:regulator of RNase E activity RraA
MALQRALADLELISRFERLDTPAVADAQQGRNVLDQRIHAFVPGRVVAGRAFTVQAPAGSMMTLQKALLETQPGDILVVDAGGDPRAGGVWGDLMSLEACQRGLRALILDGAVRDAAGLREIGFPVFATGVTPRLGTNLQIGLCQVAVSCGGAPVQPGDFVLADDNGVVVVPAHMVDVIVEAAERIRQRDREVAERLVNGERMADILGFHRFIYQAEESVSVLSEPEPITSPS